MAGTNFGYYDDWRSEVLTCPRCGWTGTFKQGNVEHYSELFDCSCPSCPWEDSPILAVVSYPTVAESEQNWEKLSDPERKQVTAIKAFQAKREAHALKSAEQLPEIEEPRIQIQWDQDSDGENTILRWREQVLWTEPACWEGVSRYAEVVDILKEKYGDRLYDVEPSPRSELYLFGDQYSARGRVEQIRAELRKSRP